MKLLRNILIFGTLPLLLAAQSNTLVLRDGRTFSGRLVDGNSGTIAFEDNTGRQYRFRTGEVQSIQFNTDNRGYEDRGTSDRAIPNRNTSDRNASDRSNASDRNNDTRRGNFNNARVLPSGTELSVRTTTTINSKDANDGQVFSASVDRDVLDSSGTILIPRGSPAELVIRAANGGGIRNSSNLVLDVQSVEVDGRRFMIGTEDLTRAGGRQGVGANKRTGEFIGGGTALGTLLGAVAGGGKGALIGALAGAAAGAGAQVLTKGSEVRVPSETVLTFRLDQDVAMNAR